MVDLTIGVNVDSEEASEVEERYQMEVFERRTRGCRRSFGKAAGIGIRDRSIRIAEQVKATRQQGNKATHNRIGASGLDS